MSDRDSLLRRALRANALFSGLSAVCLLVASDSLAGWIGAPRWLLLVIGGALLLFAVDLVLTASKSPVPRAKAISFVSMDALWVAGSVAVLLLPTPLTGAGRAVVAVVALAVAILGAAQAVGVRRQASTRGSVPTGPDGRPIPGDTDPRGSAAGTGRGGARGQA